MDSDRIIFEAVIGLEVHAELETQSKMFCACPVVDSTQAEPNIAVCPVCAGMPGVLPVVNRRAVEYGLRVALALECQVQPYQHLCPQELFLPRPAQRLPDFAVRTAAGAQWPAGDPHARRASG